MIQYNNFLMKREQSRAGSRFAECEKSRLKAKILITLALLLTAVTGAWADEPNVYNSGTVDLRTLKMGDILMSGVTLVHEIESWDGLRLEQNRYAKDGITQTSAPQDVDAPTIGENGQIEYQSITYTPVTEGGEAGGAWVVLSIVDASYSGHNYKKVSVGGIEAPLTVTWDATTKTGTFSMPGSDVVLTPQYAPAAQLDENGAPAAVSGLEIAADAAIITAGQSAQGTLLYAVGTSATEKPALTAFAATLPNAKDLTAAGNYYVWYYIQGQDTPQGQEPSAENTFNDSEIMGPVMVELLTNEHTLNIKQSPNITVTVAGTAVTPTDDKVTPVTTGQEVKIKAKDGYKFRKVEAVKVTYAEGHALTSAKFGEIVCSDGKAYAAADKDNLPKGVKAEALVCYVNGDHGLALAMADVKNAKMSWDNDRGANDGKTAAEWCDGWNTSHPIAGATWLLASQTQWNNMISAAGSASNLSNAFSAVGGTNLQAWSYWSSTPNHGGSAAYMYYFPSSSWQWTYLNQDYTGNYIRACLEW